MGHGPLGFSGVRAVHWKIEDLIKASKLGSKAGAGPVEKACSKKEAKLSESEPWPAPSPADQWRPGVDMPLGTKLADSWADSSLFTSAADPRLWGPLVVYDLFSLEGAPRLHGTLAAGGSPIFASFL